ncbi:204_t:CDS:2 [Scutellospora calospora]|uniref:204_t:CDS:1 n=1 Tax=Scutellospora calospora TaxID=85575 RepID=A0ACA9K340_9GLOM|nr:204_t:CDS:2 [Scutellospora calospora]
MDYFNQTDPECWSLLGYLHWRSNFVDFASKTYEHSVFIDIIRKISCQVGVKGEIARLILRDLKDIKNSPEVNAFWNNYNNTNIQRKRKLWQIESSDQLEKEVKLIRNERIKAQYSELTQSQFVETNASIMNLSSILNDPGESYSTIALNDDGFKTPSQRPCKMTITMPQKPTLCDKSEKNVFESTIMTLPNPDHPFQKYTFNWIEVQANCIKDAKMLFPEFDLKLNKVDRICFKVSSNKEVIFIKVSRGPENAILKHIREDTEKLIKESMFGLVALLRDFLDKNAKYVRNICTYIVQCIGDRITLSEFCLDRRHYYKISQIKSAILPFSFEEVENFIEVFELLYALVKLILADFNSNEPTIRDWI